MSKIHLLIILLAASTLLAAFSFSSQHNRTSPLTEKAYLDSLNGAVSALMDNLDLSWDDILGEMQKMEKEAIKKYGTTSRAAAFTVHKQGVIYFNKGIDGEPEAFKQAIQKYLEAIHIRENINQHNELTPEIILGYTNIAGCYYQMDNPYETITYASKGLTVAHNYSTPDSIQLQSLLLYTIAGRAYRQIGEYENAITYYNAISHLKENNSDSIDIKLGKVRALIELGGMMANDLDEPEEGISSLTKAQHDLFRYYPNEKILKGIYYYYSSIAYEKLKEYTKSKNHILESIRLNTAADDKSLLAHDYIHLGVLYKHTQQLDSSIYYLEKAENLLRKLEEPTDLAYVYDNMGDIAFLKNNYQESLIYDNTAIAYLVPGFKAKTKNENPDISGTTLFDKQGLLISLDSKATTYLELYRISEDSMYLQNAYHTFTTIDHLVSRIREEYITDNSKMWLSEKTKSIFEKSLETCWKLYQITGSKKYLERAFEFSEKSRAIILLEAIRKTHVNFRLNAEILQQVKSLSLKVNYYEKQSALQSTTKNANNHYVDSLLLYRRNYKEVMNEIKNKDPEYYDLIYNQNTVSLNKIKSSLSTAETFIEYFVGQHNLFMFVCLPDTVLFIKRPQSISIVTMVKEFNQGIQSLDQSFIEPGFRLYQELIESIGEHNTLTKCLKIVPDGALNLLPFEALPTKSPSNERIFFIQFKDYLLYNYQISYAFSATTLLQNKSDKKASKQFLGIAPYFEKGFTIDSIYFDKLEGNTQEVEEIGDLLQGETITGKDADRNTFLNNVSTHRIIHLATHALANNQNGDLSFIAFGEDSTKLLYAKDLYSLNLHADMVVLSACQTSSGSIREGEGVISLARGFIYSGASSVITSLWNVKEKVNNNIMLDFYKGIKRGMTKDDALRNAKLNFLNNVTRENQEQAHPFYWSALICVGDVSAYQDDSSTSVTLLIVLMAILLCGGLAYYYFRSKRKSISLS